MIFSTFKIHFCLSVLSVTGSLNLCQKGVFLLLCAWRAAPSAPAKFRAGDTSLEMAAAWCVPGGGHLHALSSPALSCLGAIGSLPSCLPAACWGRSWVGIRAGGTAYMQGQRQRAASVATNQAARPAQPSPCC